MKAPNFRFRIGHSPDFQTKFLKEPGTIHRCQCGYYADKWSSLICHCLRPAGTWQQEAAA